MNDRIAEWFAGAPSRMRVALVSKKAAVVGLLLTAGGATLILTPRRGGTTNIHLIASAGDLTATTVETALVRMTAGWFPVTRRT